MRVCVTETHIALGRRGDVYGSPVSLAVAAALGPDARGALPLVAVDRGPGRLDPFEGRCLPDSMPHNTRWNARLGGRDLPLPRRAQIFLDVFRYGPCGGALFAIRNARGEIVSKRPYCEVIVPFTFELPLEGE